MAKKADQSHNNLTIKLMSEPETAGLLFREHLPSDIVALFHKEPPKLLSGSFVDDDLAEHRSDLLFRVRLKKSGATYIHVLFEHKSQPDPLTPLQLFRYIDKIWSQVDGKKPKLPLTPIIPLVFYHGAQKWRVPRAFQQMFADLPDQLKPFTPQFEYAMIDLGQIDDEKLSALQRLRAYLKALKYNPRRDFKKHGFGVIVREFGALEWVDIYVISSYIYRRHSELEKHDFEHQLEQHAPERKDEIMVGFVQEIGEEYFKKGELKGKAEGKAETLLHLLAHRFGKPSGDIEQRVMQADTDTLDRWTLRVLDAKTLEDVFVG